MSIYNNLNSVEAVSCQNRRDDTYDQNEIVAFAVSFKRFQVITSLNKLHVSQNKFQKRIFA